MKLNARVWIDNLKQILQTLYDLFKERDAALDRLQEANQEIDRLQRELQNQKDSPQWRVEKQQAHRMQLEYLGTVTMLNKEIEVLQHDLQSTRDQLDMANTEVRELKRSNKDIEQQLIWKDQEIAVIFKEGMSDSRVGERKKIMDDTSQKLSSALKELDNVKTEKIALEVRVTELKKRRDELEKKEFDYVAQFRNAVQMVENSVIEKDQNQKDSPQWRVEEQQAHRMQLEYFETVTMLKKEIKALQNDLWSTRDQLDMANTEVRELKRSNKDIEQQLIWKDQELADVIFKEGMSDSREGELKKKMDDTSQK